MTQPLGDEPDGRRAVVGRGQRVRLGSTRVMVIEAPSGWRPRRGLVGTVTELVGDGEARVVFRARWGQPVSQVQVRLTELEAVRWTLPRWWWARGRFFQAVAPVAAGWYIGILLGWLFFGGDRELTDLAITGAIILGVPLVVLGVIEVWRAKTNRS